MVWPLDVEAAALLGRSHGVDARLRASVNGSGFVVPLALEPGGTVKVDGGSPARRTLDCQVVAGLTDAGVDPFAAEVRAEYAVLDETSRRAWWVPVGTFVVTGVVEVGRGRLKLSGVDRWQRVADARFERPVTTQGNTLTAIVGLIKGAHDSIPVDVTQAVAAGLGVFSHSPALWDRDRADAIRKLAQSIGAEVFMDPVGTAIVRPVPGLGSDSVWQIGSGPGGARVSAVRGVSREGTYNAVSVKAEPQGLPPVYATARVTTGRLRYGGPFGRRPRFYTTSLVRTQAGAQTMANGLLAGVQGVARTLDVESLPNPALDAGDVVSAYTDTWERHIVQAFTLPLGLGTTPLTTRTNADTEDEGE